MEQRAIVATQIRSKKVFKNSNRLIQVKGIAECSKGTIME